MNQKYQTDNNDRNPRLPRFFPVKQVPNQPGYMWITESSLRHWIFEAEEREGTGGFIIAGNGFSSAIFRIGRRILIDLDQLDLWIETHRLTEPILAPSNSPNLHKEGE